MNKVLLILIISYFFSLQALTLTNKDFTDKQFKIKPINLNLN